MQVVKKEKNMIKKLNYFLSQIKSFIILINLSKKIWYADKKSHLIINLDSRI